MYQQFFYETACVTCGKCSTCCACNKCPCCGKRLAAPYKITWGGGTSGGVSGLGYPPGTVLCNHTNEEVKHG